MRRDAIALVVLTVFAALLRLYPALQAQRFTFDGYLTLAQVQHIFSSGLLSYEVGGAYVAFLPVFYYLLAALSALFPREMVLLVVPNILSALLVPVVFLLAAHLTRRSDAALLAALSAAIIPVFVGRTFASASPYSLAVPLLFFCLYLFLRIPHPFATRLFLFCTALLALTHPLIIILIAGLVLYLVLLKVEGVPIRRAETESVFFSTLFALWVLFIFYKPMIAQGLGAFSTYVTQELFARVTLAPISAITFMGIFPIIAGAFALYAGIRLRKKAVFLLGSVAFMALLLLLLGLFDPIGSLSVIGATASILFAQFYAQFQHYVVRTRFSPFARALSLLLIVLLIISSLLPSLSLTAQEQLVPHSALAAFAWAEANTEKDATLLAPTQWGFALWALSSRQVVSTPLSHFAPDAAQRQKDVDLVYSGVSETESIRIMEKYGVSHVFSGVPRRAIVVPVFLEADTTCFRQMYHQPPYLYRAVCEVS